MQKKKEIIERQKAGAIAIKWWRAKEEISLLSNEKDEVNTKNNTDIDQTNNKYYEEFRESVWSKLWVTKVGYTSIYQQNYEIHYSSIYFIMRSNREIFY